MPLTIRETEARIKIAMSALAITEKSGEPSQFVREQLTLFVAGEITVEEMRDRVLRHHGVKE